MNKLILVIVAVSPLAAAQNPRPAFEIGQALNPAMLQYIPKQRCLIAPAQVAPCIRVRLRSVIYTIGYSDKGKNVVYIETHDQAFSTGAGLHVGSDLKSPAGGLTWLNDYGEVVAPETSDGWQPVVAQGDKLECGDGEVMELNSANVQNSAPCHVRVLSFKKRAFRGQQPGLISATQ